MLTVEIKNIINSKKMNKLQCLLCSNPFRVPKMCPFCSQIFCHDCIRDYLSEKHFCPSCDNYIIDLVDCARIVRQVQEMVVQKRNSNIQNSNDSIEQCSLHNLKLTYFCQTCSKWICSDCGVIDDQHRGHVVLQKQQASSINRQILKQEMMNLDETIYKFHTKKQKCVLDLEVYKTELRWCKGRIKQYCQSLLNRIDEQGAKQIKELQQRIQDLEYKMNSLQEKKGSLNKHSNKIMGFEKLELDHIKLYQEASELNENIFEDQIRKIQIMGQIFPDFTNFTFRFDYDNNLDEFYQYSQYFELWGQDWRLKVYPKGNSAAQGKYLSIFLELANGHHYQKSKKYVYRIQLINLNKAGSTIVKEFSSVFDIGESWGYSDYLDIKAIEDYLHQGHLLFSVGIRNENYEGLSSDLKKYIGKIGKQNKILQKLLCQSNYEQQNENREFSQFGLSRQISLLSSRQ